MTTDWNAPIDQIQADCMTLRELFRGWFADARLAVEAWDIPPCPPDWAWCGKQGCCR